MGLKMKNFNILDVQGEGSQKTDIKRGLPKKDSLNSLQI